MEEVTSDSLKLHSRLRQNWKVIGAYYSFRRRHQTLARAMQPAIVLLIRVHLANTLIKREAHATRVKEAAVCY